MREFLWWGVILGTIHTRRKQKEIRERNFELWSKDTGVFGTSPSNGIRRYTFGFSLPVKQVWNDSQIEQLKKATEEHFSRTLGFRYHIYSDGYIWIAVEIPDNLENLISEKEIYDILYLMLSLPVHLKAKKACPKHPSKKFPKTYPKHCIENSPHMESQKDNWISRLAKHLDNQILVRFQVVWMRTDSDILPREFIYPQLRYKQFRHDFDYQQPPLYKKFQHDFDKALKRKKLKDVAEKYAKETLSEIEGVKKN